MKVTDRFLIPLSISCAYKLCRNEDQNKNNQVGPTLLTRVQAFAAADLLSFCYYWRIPYSFFILGVYRKSRGCFLNRQRRRWLLRDYISYLLVVTIPPFNCFSGFCNFFSLPIGWYINRKWFVSLPFELIG